mgnify:FL=1
MGKNIIQQARGKGGPRYTSPGFNFKGDTGLKKVKNTLVAGKIMDLMHCAGHNAPLAKINYEDGESIVISAPEGVRVGDVISTGTGAPIEPGNVLALKDIPDGTAIYNIELRPGDGGKFCKTSGGCARMLTKTGRFVTVMLPSKKEKQFNADCRAVIGIIAGSGRVEKPFLKAGHLFHRLRVKNKVYPKTNACCMNAVDHPFGNKRSSRKAKNKSCSKNAPPGRKVGTLWPRRTGKRD